MIHQQTVASPVAAPGPWAACAAQRSPFWRLVAVEARKLVGTRSDKLVLAFSPIFLVGLMMLFTLTQSNLASKSMHISVSAAKSMHMPALSGSWKATKEHRRR